MVKVAGQQFTTQVQYKTLDPTWAARASFEVSTCACASSHQVFGFAYCLYSESIRIPSNQAGCSCRVPAALARSGSLCNWYVDSLSWLLLLPLGTPSSKCTRPPAQLMPRRRLEFDILCVFNPSSRYSFGVFGFQGW